MASVLVVEDEADLASTVEYNLQRDGHTVSIASSGRAALDVLGGSVLFDLVILDLMLPDISGLEVCRQLRRRDETRTLPVLMLTARGEEIDRVVGFEVGADDYVVKPFSVRELMLRVNVI